MVFLGSPADRTGTSPRKQSSASPVVDRSVNTALTDESIRGLLLEQNPAFSRLPSKMQQMLVDSKRAGLAATPDTVTSYRPTQANVQRSGPVYAPDLMDALRKKLERMRVHTALD